MCGARRRLKKVRGNAQQDLWVLQESQFVSKTIEIEFLLAEYE